MVDGEAPEIRAIRADLRAIEKRLVKIEFYAAIAAIGVVVLVFKMGGLLG